jgi:hypothetical protein
MSHTPMFMVESEMDVHKIFTSRLISPVIKGPWGRMILPNINNVQQKGHDKTG